jgi:hypothetical protein
LDARVLDDGAVGHAVWRGTDNLLNRPVAIELRVPGGAAAEEMITAAVTAGRIVHPCVIGVYDAVDEGERAFVVREWVDGIALRDAVREGLLDPGRAASIARTAADALASIHAAGHTHGNLHPGTVLLGDEEITLTDLRLDPNANQQADVRAIGGLLYAALTGHWPHELPPHQVGLPDAVRVDGRLLSPRQVRAGIPGYLDALTMDLLDPSVAAPPAIELATELRRYDVADPDLSPLTALAPEPAPQPSRFKRFLVPVAGVLCIGAAGWAVGTAILPDKGNGYGDDGNPGASKSPPPPAAAAPYKPQGVKILDPGGDGLELKNADRAIDGNLATEWRTDRYVGSPKFGNIGKTGMGVVVDLGESKSVKHVTVQLSAPGATVELRAGDAPGQQPDVFGVVGPAKQNAPAVVKFDLQEAANAQYVVVWITYLPPYEGGYAVGVKEITVTG